MSSQSISTSPPKLRRHIVHVQVREKIIFIRSVSDRPQQPGRYSFRPCLNPQLGLPLLAICVSNIKLGIASVPIFLNKLHRRFGLMFFAARSPVKVETADIAWVAPNHGILARIGLPKLLRASKRRKQANQQHARTKITSAI